MKRLLVLSVLLPLTVLSGCLEKDPVTPSQPLSPEEAQVVANCYTVQQAVEDFAVENNGVYPATTADQTPSGNTIYDLLPGGLYLVNPFTGIRTEPLDGLATLPGRTGYAAVFDSVVVGYTISGFGADSLIIILSKTP